MPISNYWISSIGVVVALAIAPLIAAVDLGSRRCRWVSVFGGCEILAVFDY